MHMQMCDFLTNRPFWGHYISYWEGSLMMAPVTCRNV